MIYSWATLGWFTSCLSVLNLHSYWDWQCWDVHSNQWNSTQVLIAQNVRPKCLTHLHHITNAPPLACCVDVACVLTTYVQNITHNKQLLIKPWWCSGTLLSTVVSWFPVPSHSAHGSHSHTWFMQILTVHGTWDSTFFPMPTPRRVIAVWNVWAGHNAAQQLCIPHTIAPRGPSPQINRFYSRSKPWPC